MASEIFQDSPNGFRAAALVQDEGGAMLYFFENAKGNHILSMVWVRNFGPVSEEDEQDDEEEEDDDDDDEQDDENNPLLPSNICAHPQGAPPLVEEDIEFLFFEAGDGVALYERGELLAVLPWWARSPLDDHYDPRNSIPGYSRDCLAEHLFAWPLAPVRENLERRLESARSFWKEWTGEADNNRFCEWRDERMATLDSDLGGSHERYFVLQQQAWPIRVGMTYPTETATYCLTLGISTQPMPGVEGRYEDPSPYRRIELGIVLPPAATRENVAAAFDDLFGLCPCPWENNAPYGELHTVSLRFYPGLANLPAALLVQEMEGIPKLTPWTFRGDPVKRLWLVRITAKERELAIDKGCQTLFDLLRKRDVSAVWEPRLCTVGKRFFGLF